ERGVRFVQIFAGGVGNQNIDTWDAHDDIKSNHTQHAAETDRPMAALLTDLKARGLLDTTLVIMHSEFGRMPISQRGLGRDHNPLQSKPSSISCPRMTQPDTRRDRPLYADVVGGVTTFFTMAYIVVVNPGILSTPGTGMLFSGVLTATVLVASSMTLLMGLYARLPFAVAPGMGLNAFFAFTIVLQSKVPWQTALGMVFWAGALFLIVSATPLREHIALAIPAALRSAAAAGIGLLLTFIGLRNAGLIVGDPAT